MSVQCFRCFEKKPTVGENNLGLVCQDCLLDAPNRFTYPNRVPLQDATHEFLHLCDKAVLSVYAVGSVTQIQLNDAR